MVIYVDGSQRAARPISLKQLACMVGLRKHGLPMGDPETAVERRLAMSNEKRTADVNA